MKVYLEIKSDFYKTLLLQVYPNFSINVYLDLPRNQSNTSTPVGQQTFRELTPSEQIDIQEVKDWYDNEIALIVPPTSTRLLSHIVTDKVVYKPGDTMFVEVFFFDALLKTPLQFRRFIDYQYYGASAFQYSYFGYYSDSIYSTLTILDSLDKQIYSTGSSAYNSTATFTWQIPESQASGEYKVMISGYSGMPDSLRVFRIRTYERQQLVASSQLDSDAYKPGDTVRGTLRVTTEDGSDFQSPPTYSYQVSFGNNSQIQEPQTSFTRQGLANFSFTIPQNTRQPSATIVFTLRYQDLLVPYTTSFSIVQPSSIVIDFYPETYNYVYDVPNKVYFQAFSNQERTEFVTLENSINLLSLNPSSNQPQTVVSGLSTIHNGRGFVQFVPTMNTTYYLEVEYLNRTERHDLNLTSQVDIEDWEINFSMDDKILANDQDASIKLYTNDKMVTTDVYVLGIFNKEKYLWMEEYQFQKSQSYQIIVPATEFNHTNGGVLRVALFRVLRPLIWQDRFQFLVSNNTRDEVTKPANYSQGYSKRTWLKDPTYVIFSIPRNELQFFKKPQAILDVEITMRQDTYEPGDLVSFEVQVSNRSIATDTTNYTALELKSRDKEGYYISAYVTDNTVYSQIPSKSQPPSLAAMIYLEKEVLLQKFEFMHANEYLDHIYQGNLSAEGRDSSDENLELLISVQGWNYGYFFPQIMQLWESALLNMTYEEQYRLMNLFAYKFQPSYQPYYSYRNTYLLSSASGGSNASGLGTASRGSGSASGSGTGEGIAAPEAMDMSLASGTGGAGGSGGTIGATPISTGVEGTDVSQGGSSLSLSEKEQQIWQFIKKYKQCQFQANTRYYVHASRLSFLSDIGSRFDTEETLLFSAANFTRNGTLKASFFLSDLVTQFRISINAFDNMGKLGWSSTVFSSRKAFQLQFQIPAIMVQGDRLDLPIYVYNNLNSSLTARLSIVDFSGNMNAFMQQNNTQLQLQPMSNQVTRMTVEALNISDSGYVQVRGQGSSAQRSNMLDALLKETKIVSPGVLQVLSQGGFIGSAPASRVQTFNLTIPDTAVPTTFKFSANIYPASYSQLLEAIRRLITQPRQCIFCSIGYSYAQVLGVIAYENSAGGSGAGVVEGARQNILADYTNIKGNQLANGAFASSAGGSPNLGVTIETLMILADMSNVIPVDKSLITSATSYIANTLTNSSAIVPPYYNQAPDYIVRAFIIWVLTALNYTENLQPHIDQLTQIADAQMTQVDANVYLIALLGGIQFNLNNTAQAYKYADYLTTQQATDGSLKQTKTFFSNPDDTYNSVIEATAMAAIVWEHDYERYGTNIQRAVDYLVKRTYIGYYYYPNQVTILSLKAIINYLMNIVSINGKGDFVLTVDGDEIARKPFTSDSYDIITFDQNDFNTTEIFESIFVPGSTVLLQLSIDNFVKDPINESLTNLSESRNMTLVNRTEDFNILYDMQVVFDDLNPISYTNLTQLTFSVEQDSNITIGSTANQAKGVPYTVRLQNGNRNTSIGMVIIILRPPSCLQINYDLLETIKRNGEIEGYEVKGDQGEVWLYVTKLDPAEMKVIIIEMVQQYVGQCRQRPHTAFEFYNSIAQVHEVPFSNTT